MTLIGQFFSLFICFRRTVSLLALCLSFVSPAEELARFSSPELISPHSQVKKAESFLLGLRVRLPDGWHSYWSFAGDFGQAPKATWSLPDHVRVQPLPLPRPKRKSFLINKKPSHSFIYEKDFLIPFSVFIEKSYQGKTLPLSLNLQWSVCKELCLSKENSLKMNLALGESFKTDKASQKIFHSRQKLFPEDLDIKSYWTAKAKSLIIKFNFKDKGIYCADILPQKKEDFSTDLPILLNQGEKSCSFQAQKSRSNLSKISGLLIYSKEGKERSALFHSHQSENMGLLWFALMAFLGGLLLNIMPCVLPLIFLKFYNILSLKSLSARKLVILNLSYSAGVIASFLVLAFAVFGLKKMGESLGWGFHLQSPLFVSVLILLFTLMAFYLLNIFSFNLPKFPLFFKSKKILSHFMTGVLSTTAASPCTVPFMAGAVGFAFSRGAVEIFVIFFFLGLGLSSPYLTLSFFPKALKHVPSPGHWTEIVKKLLSLPLFATALWLLYILYLQMDFKSFLLNLSLLALLLSGLIAHQAIKPAGGRRITAVALAGFALAIALGIKSFQKEFGAKQVKAQRDKNLLRSRSWRAFDHNKLLFDKQSGKNIFAAFGAEWCLTCKLNERIFHKREFKDFVEKNKIQLYYGDWTRKTPEISDFLESYGRQGVPFYVFFKGEEELFVFPSLLLAPDFFRDLKKLLH